MGVWVGGWGADYEKEGVGGCMEERQSTLLCSRASCLGFFFRLICQQSE